MIFRIPGKIRAKQRPRFYNGHPITPKETVNYENWVRTCFVDTCRDAVKDGPLKVTITAYFQIPKSYSKKKRRETTHPARKIDCDNIAKIVLDSLNNIAYKDDTQVMELVVRKRWSEAEEFVTCEIEDIEGE